MSNYNDAKERCKREVISSLNNPIYAKPLEKICEVLGPACECIIIGGFLRDTFLYPLQQRRVLPRDIDIVILSGSISAINKSFLPGRLSSTPLGGIRWWPEHQSIPIDIWELKKTIFFKELGIEATIENLLDGLPFNVERAAFSTRDHLLIDQGAVAASSQNIMEYDSRWIQAARVPAIAAHAVSIAKHTGLDMGQSVIDLIHSVNWTSNYDMACSFLRENGHQERALKEIFDYISSITKGDPHVIPK